MTTHASPVSGQVLVRFAPSPTGWLHVGNLRTALVNYLFAKHHGGQFMLRIDDTDRERSRDEYEAGIIEDLAWMGMVVDLHSKQSERFERYDLAKEKLKADGRLYPCYETPEELDVKRKMLVGRGLPPIYDRAALSVTAAQKAQYEREGRRPHWRFKMNHAPISWDDLIRGPVTFDGAKISDPVLIREDGVALFTLSTSVDDGEMPITHILRGEDHVSNTAVQVQVMEALGHKLPRFGHMALLKMKEGKISKREGGGDIRSLREGGVFPLVLASYLAKIGTSDAIELAGSMDELVQQFGIEKLGRAMANYDPEELARLNQKYLHHMSYAEAKSGLDAAIDEAFWFKIRGNLHTLTEAKDWWQMLHQPITPRIDDAGFTAQAATLLPGGEWGEASWDQFVNAVKDATGRKGKELFMPLRLALTGMEHGPEMKTVFALLGRARAEKRLKGEVA
ncbi:MAG: glutamate--tRNA ligase [Alphaproteobacteria bacterium]